MEKQLLVQEIEGNESTLNAVFNHGFENYPKLRQDYENNLVFEGTIKNESELTTSMAKKYFKLYPKGYGFLVQSGNYLSFKGKFCVAVLGKEKKILNDKRNNLDEYNPEHIPLRKDYAAQIKVLDDAKDAIIKLETTKGNGLKEKFQEYRKNIKVICKDNNVRIYVSGLPFSKLNSGELIMDAPAAAIDCSDFEHEGKIEGLEGFAHTSSDNSFYVFTYEDGDLMIESTHFKGGREKSDYIHFGTLIK